jgi:hypothetical protein
MKHRVALLGPSLVAAVATAQVPNIPDSAYRRDLPMVLTPAPASPSPAPQFNREAFAAAYARAGRPAIALLWNREFTDLLQQGMAYQLSIDSVHAAAGSREAVRADGYQAAGAQGAMASSTTVTQREVRSGQGLRSGPAERIDLEMRSGFVQAITGAGVRLVDRNVVMRTTAARRQPRQPAGGNRCPGPARRAGHGSAEHARRPLAHQLGDLRLHQAAGRRRGARRGLHERSAPAGLCRTALALRSRPRWRLPRGPAQRQPRRRRAAGRRTHPRPPHRRPLTRIAFRS